MNEVYTRYCKKETIVQIRQMNMKIPRRHIDRKQWRSFKNWCNTVGLYELMLASDVIKSNGGPMHFYYLKSHARMDQFSSV